MRAVVIYSGGMDSFTCLHMACKSYGYDQVHALSLDYGQRHVKELDAAMAVCEAHDIRHTVIRSDALRQLLGGSSLTSDKPVPEGHYEDKSMRQTVVPNRNMILLSLAIGLAVREGADEVWTGMHSGDHAIYPDCRPLFVQGMNQVAGIANYQPVEIVAPFLHGNKQTILEYGIAAGLDYSQTWTCYNGRERACGKCGSCQERLEAFRCAFAIDPLKYEGTDALLK